MYDCCQYTSWTDYAQRRDHWKGCDVDVEKSKVIVGMDCVQENGVNVVTWELKANYMQTVKYSYKSDRSTP
jgi:hypothetical protein